MNLLGDILAIIIVMLLITFLMKGDELLCEMGSTNVRTYQLCLTLDECEITPDLVEDYIFGVDMIEKYCKEETL